MTQLISCSLHKYEDLILSHKIPCVCWGDGLMGKVFSMYTWGPQFGSQGTIWRSITLRCRRQRQGNLVPSCLLKLAKLLSSGFKSGNWLRRTLNINIWIPHGWTCTHMCTHTHLNMHRHMHSIHMANKQKHDKQAMLAYVCSEISGEIRDRQITRADGQRV